MENQNEDIEKSNSINFDNCNILKKFPPLKGLVWDYHALDTTIKEIKQEFEIDNGGKSIERAAKVCLCGSGKFMANYFAVNELLTANGIIVTMPGIFKQRSGICDLMGLRIDSHFLYRLHYSKIKDADCVIVIAINNYIGEATQGEIDWAKSLNKKIYYLRESIAC